MIMTITMDMVILTEKTVIAVTMMKNTIKKFKNKANSTTLLVEMKLKTSMSEPQSFTL